MTIFATNGAKLFIGGVLPSKSTDFVVGDFSTEVWVEVGELEALGSVGDASNEIAFDSISANRTRRLKGTRNAAPQEVVCGLDYDDPGQIALLAAEKSIHDFAFKMTYNDAPEGGTPSERYYVAKVATAVEALETANNITKLNATLWINSNVVKVDAAEI